MITTRAVSLSLKECNPVLRKAEDLYYSLAAPNFKELYAEVQDQARSCE